MVAQFRVVRGLDFIIIVIVIRVSYRIFGLGGKCIGASMKRGNVRGGGWGHPPCPPPPPPPRNFDKLNAYAHQGCI